MSLDRQQVYNIRQKFENLELHAGIQNVSLSWWYTWFYMIKAVVRFQHTLFHMIVCLGC